VIISEDGYLVTNHHVAGRANRLVVNLADQQEIDAELVGTDPLTDIAVLKLKLDQRKDPKAPLPVAVWGDSDQVKVGDVVFAPRQSGRAEPVGDAGHCRQHAAHPAQDDGRHAAHGGRGRRVAGALDRARRGDFRREQRRPAGQSRGRGHRHQ
jgi:hypothetical protein